MLKPKPSCKGCKDRYPACQSSCRKYLTFKKELYEYNNFIRKAKRDERLSYIPNKNSDEYYI